VEIVEINLHGPADAASTLEAERIGALGRALIRLPTGESITALILSRPLSRWQERMFKALLHKIGLTVAHYLMHEVESNRLIAPADFKELGQTLRRGDVLLIESNTRVSGPIKYLTSQPGRTPRFSLDRSTVAVKWTARRMFSSKRS
jgi:hypothetical protein